MQTPRSDSVINEANFDKDEALERVLLIYTSKFCKDSLTDLLGMDFHTFFQLEMTIIHLIYRDEERSYNELKIRER